MPRSAPRSPRSGTLWPGFRSPIQQRFMMRDPMHIARLVVAIVISAVKDVFVMWLRLRTNITQKGREVMTPSVADANTAPAPIVIARMSGVATSRYHIEPRLILDASGATMSGAGVSIQAATTSSVRCAQVADVSVAEMTTVAATPPKRPWPMSEGRANGNQTAKALSGEINERWHGVASYLNLMAGV